MMMKVVRMLGAELPAGALPDLVSALSTCAARVPEHRSVDSLHIKAHSGRDAVIRRGVLM